MSWQEYSINKQVLEGRHTLNKSYSVSSVPSYLSEPLRKALVVAYNNTGVDPKVLDIVDEYTKRKPLDPAGFIHGSVFSQRLGNTDKSIEYLEQAHKISSQSTHNLIRIFVRYLELGERKRAYKVFKELSYKNPIYFPRYFNLLARETDDYELLVNNTIPDTLPNFREFDENYYFDHAIRIALRYKKHTLADLLWRKTPKKLRYQLPYGVRYLSYLKSKQNSAQYTNAWSDFEGVSLTQLESRLKKINFTDTSDKLTPCFAENKIKGAYWRIDEKGDSRQNSMKLTFDGEHNVNLYQVACSFPVEPGKKYYFSGDWSGEKITTRSGVFFEVVANGVKGFNFRSEVKNKSWAWEKFDIPVYIPEGVELITLRLRRVRTKALDNKISGSMWFDNIGLHQKSTSR